MCNFMLLRLRKSISGYKGCVSKHHLLILKMCSCFIFYYIELYVFFLIKSQFVLFLSSTLQGLPIVINCYY